MPSQISRRKMLKASGIGLTLPLLETMQTRARADVSSPPKRMVLICTALGLHPPNLWPTTAGNQYEATPYLRLLKSHRDDFTLFSGLSHEDQTGRQPHDSEMTFLTSARKPGMGGFRNTISLDQVVASNLGNATRFRSVTLGTMKSQSQSYTSGGVMIPSETSPATLFARLFLQGRPDEIAAQRQRLEDGQSILDQIQNEVSTLRRKSSRNDNHLLEDFYSSVRQAEKNIGEQQGWMDKPKPVVDTAPPKDIADPADLLGRTKLLVDLIPLILQTDSSRVVSLMVQDHYVVPKVEGVTGNHHNLSHHGQDPTKIVQLERIEQGIVQSFGSLLAQLKESSESGTGLLDSTSVLFGSNLGNANAHEAKNLPIFLAGGGFRHGSYRPQPEGTPLCNLFVTLLQRMGIEQESFGQSDGTLAW